MISSETIDVSVTYGTRYTFHLREIGMAEEQKLRSKTFGLSDEDKASKEYDQNVSILKDLSVKKPTKTSQGEAVETVGDFDIDKFFAEKTPRKERIAFYAVRGYFLRLLPSDSF
jgi:hypothetical protein